MGIKMEAGKIVIPMGSICGLLYGQLTLFTTPVIYLYMGRLANLLKRDKTPGPVGHDAPAPEGSP